jgi:DNA-binding SARP family transcriptional activator
METDSLRISLLGIPEVTYKQTHLEIKRKTLRKMLYFLACQTQPVGRSTLCELFWPDESEADARKNLRESISKLRSELPIKEMIITREDLVSLDPKLTNVDVLEFNNTVTNLRQNLAILNNGRLPDLIYADIRQALSLWRSTQFMSSVVLPESIPFQNWISETNQSLSYWRQMMLEWMADHCIAIGNLHEALSWLSSALLNDHMNVELNYLTLNCLKDLGVRAEELHFCDFLESIYHENGESTLPGVLKELIIRVREEPDIRIEKLTINWNLQEGKESNFIGHSDLVQLLTQAVHRGGLVLLSGEPSSGKTRLLKEFYNNLEVVPRLVYCRARKGESNLDYQPLVDGLRHGVLDEEWQKLDLIYAQTLYPLFPELVKIRNDVEPREIEFSLSLQRLIPEAFHKLTLMLANRRRVLFIMDDAQWCDGNSLKVLNYIHERGGAEEIGTGILVTRNDETNPFLSKMFSVEAKSRLIDRIDIQPLNEDQVDEVARSLLGIHLEKSIIRWIIEGSGGNIGYLIEILEQLPPSSVDIDRLAKSGTWPTSPHLEGVLDERVKNISDLSFQLLPILAILENKIEPIVIEKLTDKTIPQISDSFLELQAKKILMKNKNNTGNENFCFVHGVLRQRILENIDPSLRIGLEKKISNS